MSTEPRLHSLAPSVLALCVVGVVISSCTGQLLGLGGNSGQNPTTPNGGTAGGTPGETPVDPGIYQPPAASIRVLTASQYVNAMKDFGFDEKNPPALEVTSVAAATSTPALAVVESLDRQASLAASALLKSGEWKKANVTCDLSQAACRKTTLAALGERAFRRPMTDDEAADYQAAFETLTDSFQSAERALEFVVAALLQSPSFVYRVELEDGRRKLTADAVASRIAFLLTNAPPDAALRTAAKMGELDDSSVRKQQATRLLELPGNRIGARRFFEDWLQLDKVKSISKRPTVFPSFSPELIASMREQAIRNVERIAFGKGDARSFFDEAGAEVDSLLAPLYEAKVSTADGWVKLSAEQAKMRRGVLGWPALLALHSKPQKTSLTERGVFILNDVLCGVSGIPPPVFPPLPDIQPNQTVRQLMEQHRKQEPCKSCHARFDPMGIVLEQFDSIGAFRTKDNGIDIDPSGEFVDPLGERKPEPVADAIDLAQKVRAHPNSSLCLVQKLTNYTLGRGDSPESLPWIQSLHSQWGAENYDWQALAVALVASPEFTQAGAAQ
jgi:Protein of unknown function (DUF1588)/Protein of unknown function (DUF1592)/Protein of unknown function (DUF1595)/Protein of unknown function (DUF1585)